MQLRGHQVLNDRLLLKAQGRIREVTVGPDGYPIYFSTTRRR